MHLKGKTYFLSTEPKQHLPRASELGRLRKDQLNRLLDASVWIHLDFAIGGPAIADW